MIAKEASPARAERASAVLPEAAAGATRASQPIAQVTSGVFWRWGLVVVAMAIAAVAVYVVMSGRNDETRSQIQALEARMKDKETADAAERQTALNAERQAKQRAEEETRQRAAQEQALAEASKAQAQPAGTREPAAKPQPTPQASAPKTAPAYVASPAKLPPSAAISSAAKPSIGATPTATQKEATPQPVAAVSATPAAPEPNPVRPAPAEQLADAERAFAAQHYADAIAIVKPLAEAGNAQAQVRLGDAYAEGRGVQHDAEAAEKWYEKAALQGNTGAQLKLGSMFATGNGLVRNNNLAYVWYGTAAQLGSSTAKAERDKIAASLQPAERAQADKLIAAKVEAMAKKP